MVFEDGREPTLAALRLFDSQKDQLNCPAFKDPFFPGTLKQAEPVRLTNRDKEVLVEQAILLIDQFYAHLPYKRTRYATDPVRRFRVIHAQLHHFPTDLAFHDQMIQAFMRLRGAHTFYGLPLPYQGAFAFLPFRMDYGEVSKFPHAFEFQYTGGSPLSGYVDPECLHDPEHPDKKFGYVRIKTFMGRVSGIDPSGRSAGASPRKCLGMRTEA